MTAFLQRQYGERDAANFAHEIIDISKHVVTALSMIYSEMLSEAAIIFRIDENQQIKLVEVNPSGPDRIYDAEKMAASVIGYADYLVSLNTDPQIER